MFRSKRNEEEMPGSRAIKKRRKKHQRVFGDKPKAGPYAGTQAEDERRVSKKSNNSMKSKGRNGRTEETKQ